jgi:hypothetical protein
MTHTNRKQDAARAVAHVLELLLIDLTDGYNTTPRGRERAGLVDDCLTTLSHFRTVDGKQNQ